MQVNLRHRPLVKIAIVFLPAIYVGYNCAQFIPWWFLLGFLLLIIILVLVGILKSQILEVFTVYLVVFFSGYLAGSSNCISYEHLPVFISSLDSAKIAFSATIHEEDFSSIKSLTKLAKLDYLILEGEIYRNQGKVLLKLNSNANLHYGNRIIGIGKLEPIPTRRNPGDYDLREYCRRADIRAIIRSDVEEWKIIEEEGSWLMEEIIIPARKAITDKIEKYIPEEEGEALKGIILGVQTGLSSELKHELRLSGLWHLISLSGSHIGIISGIILLLLSIFGIKGEYRWAIIIVTIVGYSFLAVSRAPMVRAVIIVTVLAGSRYLKRYTDYWNLLALSALLIVVLNPAELFSPGFQLSYIAVIFILAGQENWWDKINSGLKQIYRSVFLKYIIGLLLISLVASIGTASLLAYHFGGIPLASIPASVMGIPLTSIMMFIFPIFYISTLIFPWLAEILGNSLWIAVKGFSWLVKLSAESGLFILTPDFTIWELFLLIIPLFLLVLRKRQWLWSGLLITNIFIWKSIFTPVNAELTFLNVGQGNCAILTLPGNHNLLIDAGSKTRIFNSGEKTIVPYLERKGIKKLEYSILSHNDVDHTSGIEYILKHIEVENLIIGAWSLYPELRDREKIIIKKAGDWLKVDGALLLFFNPLDSIGSDNEQSLVFSIRYQGNTILFTGDISREKESRLLGYAELLDCDILSISHHGSKYSSSEEFLQATTPKYAIISCGKNNFYGHPAGEILDRLQRHGSKVYRTDIYGAIEFLLGNSGISYQKAGER